jgi:hypothetical protein
MSSSYRFREAPQRREYIGKGLMRARLGKKDDEIDRMAGMQRDAYFGIAFKSADTRPVSCSRIEHYDGRFVGVDAVVPTILANLGDPQESVVRWSLEETRIEQHLILEVEQRRQSGIFVLKHVVRTTAQGVEEQDRALKDIFLILEYLEW